MNKKLQRYKDTILFKNPDKIPLYLGKPRESTLKAWHSQGLNKDTNYLDTVCGELNIDRSAMLEFHSLDASFSMFPEYEPEILEHTNGHYIIRDWMGATTEITDNFDPSYIHDAKDFVTRKWHKFPVENKTDWENMKQRFDSNDKNRIKIAKEGRPSNPTSLSFNGVFWQLREWCGFENLCIFMAEKPEFVHEMSEFWTDFVARMLDKTLKIKTPDRVLISEDMAYKAHSMISPEMTREFILPAYRKWAAKLKSAGCEIIEIDSDGYIEELIPLWIEEKINCASPIEVAAHCDIVRFREKFGKNMAYMQGIDKRIIARGGAELTEHVMNIVPALFKDGGYIPGCDHGVPSDISWGNYLEFAKIIAKLSGWL